MGFSNLLLDVISIKEGVITWDDYRGNWVHGVMNASPAPSDSLVDMLLASLFHHHMHFHTHADISAEGTL